MSPRTAVRGEPLRRPPAEQPRSLVDHIHDTVEQMPAQEAIRWKGADGWESWTFRQLWDEVQVVSMGLHRLGVGAGDRVVVLSRSGPWWVVADLSILALGAVVCPIYPGDPPARMAETVQRLGARFALVENEKLLARLRSSEAGAGLEIRVVLFEDGNGSHLTLGRLRAANPPSEHARATWERTWATVNRAQVATIVHTIGADGEPKGVVVTHGNVLHSVEAVAQAISLSSTDVGLSVLPMSHMFERAAGTFCFLGSGVTLVFAERSLDRWVANLAEVRPTLMTAIPLFFERIEQRIREDVAAGPGWHRAVFGWATGLGRAHYHNHLAGRADGPWHRLQRRVADRLVLSPVRRAFGGRLRLLVSGGAALPESTGLFFESLGMTIIEGYGLTETAPMLTINRWDSYRYGTVGLPAAETEIRLDPVSGEILARGPQVMLGYLDRPEDTARVLDAEGWLRTGDVGEFDEAGRLRITGRTKDLLVLATGKNVAPAPIEDALARSPYIRRAILLGDDRDATGVLLEVADDALPGGEDPTDLLRREIDRLTADFATFERPRRFVVLRRPLDEALAGMRRGPGFRAAVLEAYADEVADLFDRVRHEPGRATPEAGESVAADAATVEPTPAASD